MKYCLARSELIVERTRSLFILRLQLIQLELQDNFLWLAIVMIAFFVSWNHEIIQIN